MISLTYLLSTSLEEKLSSTPGRGREAGLDLSWSRHFLSGPALPSLSANSDPQKTGSTFPRRPLKGHLLLVESGLTYSWFNILLGERDSPRLVSFPSNTHTHTLFIQGYFRTFLNQCYRQLPAGLLQTATKFRDNSLPSLGPVCPVYDLEYIDAVYF